ncbi:3-isopropylmalate dehydratase large subunit, partial [Dissostichus eleginoides]
MDDTGKVGSKSADYSKVRGVTVVLRPRGSPDCIWDDLPIVREQRLPCSWSGLGLCPRPTSSDTQLLPIHLPSLCTE